MTKSFEPDMGKRNPKSCRACDNVRGNKEISTGVYSCSACEAIFGTCYLGDSYGYVYPWMTDKNVSPEKQRYFDFTTIGSNGVSRRHGWYDVETKLITQMG